MTIIAEVTGSIASAFGLLGAAIGVGLIGQKAAEAVGRNPGASGKVLVQAIIGMALAEGRVPVTGVPDARPLAAHLDAADVHPSDPATACDYCRMGLICGREGQA